MGDSNTNNHITRCPEPWPATMETDLDVGGDYDVTNYATGGDTAAEQYSDWTATVRATAPDIVTIMVGTNDLCVPSVQADDGQAIWDDSVNPMITEALADGADVVIMAILPCKGYAYGWSSTAQTEIDAFNALAAARGGVTFFDTYAFGEDDVTPDYLESDYDVGDGLHINTIGCSDLAADMADVIRGL